MDKLQETRVYGVPKMAWSGEEVAKWIRNISSESIQPNGVDLTVSEIYEVAEKGFLGVKDRVIPSYKLLEGDSWSLKPGAYIVRYSEWIRIPPNAIGIVLPRSSLLRMGATIFSALWDSGYEGRGIGLLHVFNPFGIKIEKGARIAQIILISARSSGEYKGIWKGEGKNALETK